MKEIFAASSRRLSIFVLGGALVLAGSAVAFTQKPKAEAFHPPVVDQQPVDRNLPGRSSFAPVVKQVSPGVVKVFVTTTIRREQNELMPPDMDEFFRQFFGDRSQGPGSRRRGPVVQRQQGIGSGVIVTEDGYILTNNHVVDGAQEVNVSMQDGREFTAKVIGRDPKSDVAVIKINATKLPTVPMADSDKVEVGDVVLAIGNPFGIGQTVTTGIVSAKGRGGLGLSYEDFIQTDAAINPGNSGGALVDAQGRLIGINTAILSRSGGNQGIGFAIPSNMAREVMSSLITEGHVTRGYMGVNIQDLDAAMAKQFGLKESKGVLVADVQADSPAAKAGVENGDVVLEFNGKAVGDSRQLKLEVSRVHPGTTVPMKVLRDGTEKTLNVSIKDLSGSESVARSDEQSSDKETGTLNGVAVSDLDREARQQLGVPARIQGALVSNVEADSASAEAGLQTGDIIQEINHKPVKNAEDAVRLTEHVKSKTTLLRIWRNGASHYLVVDESKDAK